MAAPKRGAACAMNFFKLYEMNNDRTKIEILEIEFNIQSSLSKNRPIRKYFRAKTEFSLSFCAGFGFGISIHRPLLPLEEPREEEIAKTTDLGIV